MRLGLVQTWGKGGKEKFEIARTADTKVTGELKFGTKVTVEYSMTAKPIEAKEDKVKGAKDAVKDAGKKASDAGTKAVDAVKDAAKPK